MTPFGGTIETTGSRTHLRLFVSLALALVASAGVLWIATGELLLVLAYSLGIAILLAGALAFQRMQAAPESEVVGMPDWSVTVAAIEVPGAAVAITDRAKWRRCTKNTSLDTLWRGAWTRRL